MSTEPSTPATPGTETPNAATPAPRKSPAPKRSAAAKPAAATPSKADRAVSATVGTAKATTAAVSDAAAKVLETPVGSDRISTLAAQVVELVCRGRAACQALRGPGGRDGQALPRDR